MAERAYQRAVEYAQERRQGRAPGAPGGEKSLIVDHPDVRRMLLTMRALTEAMRALAYLQAAGDRPGPARARRGRPHRGPGDGRPAHPAGEELLHRRGRDRSPRSASRSTAAWATSRRPASPSTTATSRSPRSTRAPTASRPWTSSAASCRCAGRRHRRPGRATCGRRSAELAEAGDELEPIRDELEAALDALETANAWLFEQGLADPVAGALGGHALPAAAVDRRRRAGSWPAPRWRPPALGDRRRRLPRGEDRDRPLLRARTCSRGPRPPPRGHRRQGRPHGPRRPTFPR